MFCPRCAAQNLEDAKFCRGCGTNLETVALALNGKYQPTKTDDEDEDERPKNWLELRRYATNKLVRASGLLGSSLLIGAALGIFSNANDWIIIWMVFAGWMAVWGVFSLISGITATFESRYLREEQQNMLPEMTTGQLAQPLLTHRSVTEHTTKSLAEQRPKQSS